MLFIGKIEILKGSKDQIIAIMRVKFIKPSKQMLAIIKVLTSKSIKFEHKSEEQELGFTTGRGVWHWFTEKFGYLSFTETVTGTGTRRAGLIQEQAVLKMLERVTGFGSYSNL